MFFSKRSRSSGTTSLTNLASFKRSILAKRNSAASFKLLPCGASRARAASASCRVAAGIPKEDVPSFSFFTRIKAALVSASSIVGKKKRTRFFLPSTCIMPQSTMAVLPCLVLRQRRRGQESLGRAIGAEFDTLLTLVNVKQLW